MNSEVEVRKSAIDGKGVFAGKSFRDGEVVFIWDTSHVVESPADVPEHERDFVARFEGKWIIMQEPMRYVNHSCDANTRSEHGKDIAIREIKKGEEITSDYRSEMKGGERMECHCGALNCKGYIIGTGV